MIVVVIVAILAAIAYPAYSRYVQNSRAATAQADLLELAQWMERRYTLNNTYVGAVLPFTQSPREGTTVGYQLQLENVTQNAFTLRAVPQPVQTGHPCGEMTLNQANVRTPAGANCWR
jgi:type IV pilus assembly protein PilE